MVETDNGTKDQAGKCNQWLQISWFIHFLPVLEHPITDPEKENIREELSFLCKATEEE